MAPRHAQGNLFGKSRDTSTATPTATAPRFEQRAAATMALNAQPLLYVCRSCRQSTRQVTVRAAVRAFTTTPSQSKEIPTFTPTASPDFDAILLEWRRKVFTPAALQEHHRRLMYRKSRQHHLTGETGVTVTLSNGEDVRLEPMDAYDKPNARSTTTELIKLLAETNDPAAWNNLTSLLEGLVLAKQKLPPFFLERLARKANELDRAGILVACAERPKATGVRLSHAGFTRELMLGIHTSAAEADFQGPDLDAAARRATHIAQLLESPAHCGGRAAHKSKPGHGDMRRDTGVVSVLLELAAAKALNAPADQELQQAARSFTAKMLAITEAQIGAVLSGELFDTNIRSSDKDVSDHAVVQDSVAAANSRAVHLTPLFNACQLAEKVEAVKSDKAMLDALRKRKAEVQTRLVEDVAKLRVSDGEKSRRGLLMYEQISKGGDQ